MWYRWEGTYTTVMGLSCSLAVRGKTQETKPESRYQDLLSISSPYILFLEWIVLLIHEVVDRLCEWENVTRASFEAQRSGKIYIFLSWTIPSKASRNSNRNLNYHWIPPAPAQGSSCSSGHTGSGRSRRRLRRRVWTMSGQETVALQTLKCANKEGVPHLWWHHWPDNVDRCCRSAWDVPGSPSPSRQRGGLTWNHTTRWKT